MKGECREACVKERATQAITGFMSQRGEKQRAAHGIRLIRKQKRVPARQHARRRQSGVSAQRRRMISAAKRL